MALKESTLKTEESTLKTEESTPEVQNFSEELEVQKFSKEELETLTSLQVRTQNITMRLGQLYISKHRLKQQEETLTTYLKNLEEEESKLAENLSNKYGKGSIDIETGEFTPSE